VKLPGRAKPKPRRGSFVARGTISGTGDLGSRLRELGVPVHDPLGDSYGTGLLGRLSRHVGMPHPGVVEGDVPRGARIERAPELAPRMTGRETDGTVWNGPESTP
jgi:hypothetical protein